MSRMTFREFIDASEINSEVPIWVESLSTHAKERALERTIPEEVQKLVSNIFEPFLYYYLNKNIEFDIKKSGEKGTEFVVVLKHKGEEYCLVGTYKKDKMKTNPTPFILWLTMFKIRKPLFIKSGTAYRFDIRELSETERDVQTTIRTNRRRFSFEIQKNPSTLH